MYQEQDHSSDFGSSSHRTSDEPFEVLEIIREYTEEEHVDLQKNKNIPDSMNEEKKQIAQQESKVEEKSEQKGHCVKCQQLNLRITELEEENRRITSQIQKILLKKDEIHENSSLNLENMLKKIEKLEGESKEYEKRIREFEQKEKKRKLSEEIVTKVDVNYYISSLKEVNRSYEEEAKSIINFLEKTLSIRKTNHQKSLKQLIERAISDMLANWHQVNRELTIISHLSKRTISQMQKQSQSGKYNHYALIRKIIEIKENLIHLQGRDI